MSAADEARTAYRLAPPLTVELSWLAADCRYRADMPGDERTSREYRLRKAAALDRIALRAANTRTREAATEAAEDLAIHDDAHQTHTGPIRPDAPIWRAFPCGYIRQEYAVWLRCQCDAIGFGPCPRHPDPNTVKER